MKSSFKRSVFQTSLEQNQFLLYASTSFSFWPGSDDHGILVVFVQLSRLGLQTAAVQLDSPMVQQGCSPDVRVFYEKWFVGSRSFRIYPLIHWR